MTEIESKTPLGNKLPAVRESVLKHRKRRDTFQSDRLKARLKHRTQLLKKKKDKFRRAESFVKENLIHRRDELRIARQTRNLSKISKECQEQKLAFVIRIRGTKDEVSPQIRKVLHLLRLKVVFTGIFVKLNPAVLAMLKICEPYITWGYPNLKSVRELIFKRGFAKIDKKRQPITSNTVIENVLGSKGFICTEDLIHEIFSVGEQFQDVAAFFWPFRLATPTGGFNKKMVNFSKGGDYGNRADKINELIRKMV